MENSNLTTNNIKGEKLNTVYILILMFFIYAVIGWLLETGYAIYNFGHFVKRGFLYGPMCPIYGYGAVILISCIQKYKDNSIKLFLYSIVIFSIFEYIVGFALDALFAEKWWDYTNEFFNLNGRISIFYSFVWGIFAILFANHIHPFIEKITNKFLEKIPFLLQITGLYLIICIYFLDTVLSISRHLI